MTIIISKKVVGAFLIGVFSIISIAFINESSQEKTYMILETTSKGKRYFATAFYSDSTIEKHVYLLGNLKTYENKGYIIHKLNSKSLPNTTKMDLLILNEYLKDGWKVLGYANDATQSEGESSFNYNNSTRFLMEK